MTNFGAIDQNTTVGTATGDLRGAVRGTLLGTPQPGSDNTMVSHLQHHWVTSLGTRSCSIQLQRLLFRSRRPYLICHRDLSRTPDGWYGEVC
jgi:hypothetical protein